MSAPPGALRLTAAWDTLREAIEHVAECEHCGAGRDEPHGGTCPVRAMADAVTSLDAEVRELRARLATAEAVCGEAVRVERASEREACAQVAERWGNDDAADEIRARGGAR